MTYFFKFVQILVKSEYYCSRPVLNCKRKKTTIRNLILPNSIYSLDEF